MGPDIEIESQAPGTQIPSLPISTIAAPSPLAAPAPEVDRRDEAEADLAIRELCHDLRQPVATIAALAEACRVTPGLSPEVQTRLLHILEESARMSALIRQLLSQRLTPVAVDLGELAREAAASAQITSPGVVQAVVQSGAVVMADEVALRRVLANLVDNAVRAAGEGGSVILTVKRSGGWVRCDVADSGPGFGEGPAGFGSYGLGIVDRFLRSHNGRLEIRRSKLGGALVRMRLPASQGRPE